MLYIPFRGACRLFVHPIIKSVLRDILLFEDNLQLMQVIGLVRNPLYLPEYSTCATFFESRFPSPGFVISSALLSAFLLEIDLILL